MLQPKQLGITDVWRYKYYTYLEVRNQMRGTSGGWVWVLISVLSGERRKAGIDLTWMYNVEITTHTTVTMGREDGGGLSTVTCNHRHNNSLSSKCSKGKHGNVRKLKAFVSRRTQTCTRTHPWTIDTRSPAGEKSSGRGPGRRKPLGARLFSL